MPTRKTYSGPLELGEDLMVIEIGDTVTVRRPPAGLGFDAALTSALSFQPPPSARYSSTRFCSCSACVCTSASCATNSERWASSASR